MCRVDAPGARQTGSVYGMTFPVEAYEVSFGTLCSGTVGRLLEDTSVPDGTTRHLDLGCGTGTLAEAAADRGREVTAVDIDPAMVARCGMSTVCRGSALDLPLASGTFDVATANFLVNHLPDPRRGVAEIARVLRPGGRTAMTIWPAGTLAWAGLVTEAFEAAGVVPLTGQRLPERLDFERSVDGLRGIAREAGLSVTVAEAMGWDWTVTPSDLWRGVSGGVGTAGRTYLAHAPEVQRRADAEFFDRTGGDTLSFAMTAAYVVAERPW